MKGLLKFGSYFCLDTEVTKKSRLVGNFYSIIKEVRKNRNLLKTNEVY